MTKAIIMLIAILLFWFTLGVTMAAINQDEGLSGLAIAGNATLVTGSRNQTAYNLSFSSDLDNSPTAKTFWDMIKSVFTFSMSDNIAFPILLSTLIGFLNFILLLTFFIISYVLIVHGGN